MKKYFLILLLSLASFTSRSQILISLVFGDKLNSGTVEFGLDGGANFTSLQGLNGSTSTGFNLGFYFDIKTKSKWIIHTGVLVKSPMGVDGLSPYTLNIPELDTAFIGGEVQRNLRYFNVPVMFKYPLGKNFYAEGGIMLGLLYKGFDLFTQEINKPEDLTYQLDNRKNYHPLDAGVMAGLVYRLMGGNGMNLAVRYYYGFVDITLDDSGANVYNSSLYLAVGIPIGAGKAKEKKE